MTTTHFERTLESFLEEHANDSSSDANNKKDILFICNPNSGGGNAMRKYPTVLAELKATGRSVEVYLTKSSEDVINLSQTKDLTPYQTIVVLAGDSTLYELVQEPLRQNNGKWPYQATLLLLPGGSSNVIVLEDFGETADYQQIIRETLSLWPNNTATAKKASVIQMTSPNSPTRYGLHVCMTGFMPRLIDYAEARRKDVYPTWGKAGWIFAILSYIPRMPNQDDDPTHLNVCISDIEPGSNFGFGISRFGDMLTVVHVPKDKNPGKMALFQSCLHNLMAGQLSEEWRAGTLPEFVTVEKTHKWVYQHPTPGSRLKFYSDGTSRVPFETTDDTLTFEALTDALPFWVVSNKELVQRKEWQVETVAVLSNCQSIQDAYTQLTLPTTFSVQGEQLKEGSEYATTTNSGKLMVLKSVMEDQECQLFVSMKGSLGLVHREVRVSVIETKDGVIVGRVREKCTKGAWMDRKEQAEIRKEHEHLLSILNNEDRKVDEAGVQVAKDSY